MGLRRQLDLQRWVRGREFTHLHGVSVTWMDSHFEAIERGAPWLSRVGSDVWDYCKGGVKPFFRLTPGFSASAGCIRKTTAVYGFDGPLTSRLRSLDQAMPPAGWEMSELARRQTWTDLDESPVPASYQNRWMTNRRVILRWRPAAALGYPPDGEGTPPWGQPPLTPHMEVSWSSRGQEPGWGKDPNKDQGTTRNYVRLEVSRSAVPDLLAETFTRYEHALTITISLTYYLNPNARARPHRLPHYLLPTRTGH